MCRRGAGIIQSICNEIELEWDVIDVEKVCVLEGPRNFVERHER